MPFHCGWLPCPCPNCTLECGDCTLYFACGDAASDTECCIYWVCDGGNGTIDIDTDFDPFTPPLWGTTYNDFNNAGFIRFCFDDGFDDTIYISMTSGASQSGPTSCQYTMDFNCN